MSGKHILIVGGGIIGLCTAYYLLQRGHRVTLVERGASDHDSCSLGNAGMVVPSHFVPLAAPGMVEMGLRMMANPESPFYVRPRLNADLLDWGWRFIRSANATHVTRSAPLLRDLSLASRCAYEELAETFGNPFELVKRGLLMLCKTEKTMHEEAHLVESAERLSLSAQVLNPQEAARIDPGVRMDIAGAVYFPQDCHLTPRKLVDCLTQAIAAGGAELLWETEVTGWRVADGRVLSTQTNRGELSADEYVLAAGSWSPTLLRGLHLRLPMQAGKGYSVTLPKPRQLPHLCSILTEARVAVTPMGETLRIGGTMEIAGLNETVNPVRVRGILRAVPDYFPEFGPEDFKTVDGQDLPVWCGLRPCSPDGLPYVGRFRRYANLSVGTGHAMMGVSLGPITGKLVSMILSGDQPDIDITGLNPDRCS
jgi:D-amino-acid dehydrogenase